ncbi:MAG TPA: co-chaperone GroES [Candidatus Gracilibacteria bacterium]|nr:co-chaperone GroES [Candidatus Gracilibacteria bacterium]
MNDQKKLKLHPLEDHIVVEALDEMETHSSGLIIPDTVSKEKPQKGVILAVGPGKFDQNGKRVPMDVKEGDKVLFTKYGPTEVKIDGKEYLILTQSDVLAVME